MGEFRSGTWIVGLSLYFFTFFLIVYSLTNAGSALGVDHDVTYNDPGFLSVDPENTTLNINTTIDPNNPEDISSVYNTLTIMTGFNTNIGLPSTITFVFSFFAFWIPALLLVWSIYMALPFLH